MAEFLHGVEVVEINGGARPIRVTKSNVIGLIGTAPDADAVAFPLNTPVLVAGSRTEAAKLDTVGDGNGTLPWAIDGIFDQVGAAVVVVRVEDGADEDETIANIIGGVDAEGAALGVQCFLEAEAVTGVSPRVLIAPGWTHQRPADAANPVAAEMKGIADRLRAVMVIDGPNSNDAAALAVAGEQGGERVYLVDPWCKVSRGTQVVDEPSSARVAGLIAKVDAEDGFWNSPSNRELNGIVGTSRPVDFRLGDANARANLLNAANVATIIRQGGYRLWGNRTLSTDQKWAFLSVRRTADIINDSLLRAHLWAVDRNITKTYVQEVQDGVNAFLRELQALGAILGGRCWADPDLNKPESIADGKMYFNFDFTPPYPAEHIVFRSHLVGDYLEEVVQ